jgi:hypothetical protein
MENGKAVHRAKDGSEFAVIELECQECMGEHR